MAPVFVKSMPLGILQTPYVIHSRWGNHFSKIQTPVRTLAFIVSLKKVWSPYDSEADTFFNSIGKMISGSAEPVLQSGTSV